MKIDSNRRKIFIFLFVWTAIEAFFAARAANGKNHHKQFTFAVAIFHFTGHGPLLITLFSVVNKTYSLRRCQILDV